MAITNISQSPISMDLLTNNGSLETASSPEFNNLVDMGKGVMDQINQSHQFMQQVMNSAHVPNAREMRKIQDQLSEFSVYSQLLSKTVSIAIKDLDTLTKIQ
jgi:hypothetical protein